MKRFTHLLSSLLLPILLGAEKPSLEAIEKQLSRPILAADQSLEEVQAYCESRVPDVPEFKKPETWLKESARIRREVLDKVVFRGEEAKAWRNAESKVVWDEVIEGLPGYRIKKLRFEILRGNRRIAGLSNKEVAF